MKVTSTTDFVQNLYLLHRDTSYSAYHQTLQQRFRVHFIVVETGHET
jgi:hypothetical protein